MFDLQWTEEAECIYHELEKQANEIKGKREKKQQSKTSKQEGLFKQVQKTLRQLRKNPGLETHPYFSLEHPWDSSQKVFEAYAQNNTPAAYRVFWCYGPDKKQITIIAITAHPLKGGAKRALPRSSPRGSLTCKSRFTH